MKSKHIAIDFDGVICDSINECLVVGLRAYYKSKGHSIVPKELSEIQTELIEFDQRHVYFPPNDN